MSDCCIPEREREKSGYVNNTQTFVPSMLVSFTCLLTIARCKMKRFSGQENIFNEVIQYFDGFSGFELLMAM